MPQPAYWVPVSGAVVESPARYKVTPAGAPPVGVDPPAVVVGAGAGAAAPGWHCNSLNDTSFGRFAIHDYVPASNTH